MFAAKRHVDAVDVDGVYERRPKPLCPLGIPNPDDYFQTRVSGLDTFKPWFQVRVLQL